MYHIERRRFLRSHHKSRPPDSVLFQSYSFSLAFALWIKSEKLVQFSLSSTAKKEISSPNQCHQSCCIVSFSRPYLVIPRCVCMLAFEVLSSINEARQENCSIKFILGKWAWKHFQQNISTEESGKVTTYIFLFFTLINQSLSLSRHTHAHTHPHTDKYTLVLKSSHLRMLEISLLLEQSKCIDNYEPPNSESHNSWKDIENTNP